MRLSLAIAAVIVGSVALSPSPLEARVIDRPQTTGDWRTLSELDVESGSTVPVGRNVFFQVPVSVKTISRETLLGHRGEKTRYWGYCFADEKDPENPPQGTAFTGKLFLSEAERAWRKAEEARRTAFMPFQRPTAILAGHGAASPIRHQLEIFHGGMTCYVMTAADLPIGVDNDGDNLNAQEEKAVLGDPTKADTDGDGLNDSAEVRLGTSVRRRDSDSDGLIDGIEDANHNGRWDIGETDPRKRDTDNDELCDGLCREYKVRAKCKDNKATQCMDVAYGQPMGEDKNFNGKVDPGESDPRKADSVGNGTRDDVRFFKCLLDGKKNC